MPYLLDTNVFIQAKNLHYGFDFCPAFWEWLDIGNKQQNVFSIEKVRDELALWAENRDSGFFLPPTPSTLSSLEALSSWAYSGHYEPVAVNTFLQSADYYLVAQALANNYVVVSHENIANTAKKSRSRMLVLTLKLKSCRLMKCSRQREPALYFRIHSLNRKVASLSR
jgi:hypothetical protein